MSTLPTLCIAGKLGYHWSKNTCRKIRLTLLVSTCERLSVMHEPEGVVEILVQILQFTPIL